MGCMEVNRNDAILPQRGITGFQRHQCKQRLHFLIRNGFFVSPSPQYFACHINQLYNWQFGRDTTSPLFEGR